MAVAGVFRTGRFTPRKFQWGSRVLQVDEVTLVSDLKDGGVRQRRYGVVSGGNLYRLLFNRENEQWILEEIWVES